MSPLLVFLILLNAYFLLLFVLIKTGWMRRLNMSLFGPALMLKTQRGRWLLDWFAKARRFFDYSAGFGIWMTGAIMALMSLLLAVQLWFLFQIPVEATPDPILILGIPGINPIIPLGFGIVALVFAVVVHEFSHGILARVHHLRVQTMGLLFFIVPIGAFVEPDEAELKAAPRRQRLKVFAAGPTSNLAFALLFGLLFSGALIHQAEPIPGVAVSGVEEGGPAEDAGLLPGAIITRVDSTPVRNRTEFTQKMNTVVPGSSVNLALHEGAVYRVETRSCTQMYGAEDCRRIGYADPDNKTLVGIQVAEPRAVVGALASPFSDWRSALFYVGLPFQALTGDFPLTGAFTSFYETPFHAPTFWFLVNLAYWLFWINLMLGLTNALPIVPLDGGHMFRDFVGGFLDRRRPDASPERKEAIVRRVSLTVTFVLLGLIVMQFFAARIGSLLF